MRATGSSRQRGFSMVELLLVIGVIASMAVGAFLLYPRLRLSLDVNATEQKFITITGATREYFGENSYADLSNAMAVAAGIAETSELTTPWGAIDLQPTASGNGFRFDFYDIPKDACQKLMARLEPGSLAVRVGPSTYVKNDGTTYNALTAPATCGASQTVSFWPSSKG